MKKVSRKWWKRGRRKDKAVSYAEIVPVLIEAIKEQQKAIQDLKAELEKMKVQ